MDKRATKMLGLPIVTLDGGKTLARVEDFIVDPQRKQALALVISEKGFRQAARAVPFGRIQANGPDAVIVANDKVSLAIEQDPVLKQLDNSFSVLEARVLTDGGRELGTVTDMVLDDHTGEIKGYDVQANNKVTRWLPSETVLSLGRKMMLVTDATADLFDAQAAAAPVEQGESTPDAGVEDSASTQSVIIRPNSGKRKLATEASPLADPGQGVVDDNLSSASPVAMVEDALAGTLDLANKGGSALNNTRLLFGIVLLVLGILILVYPNLLPLIAGISLIVIGLWIALQNAAGARS